jgi:hypothetical protein
MPWGSFGSLIPYVGGGLGLARNWREGESKDGLVWHGSAGLGIQVVRGVTVEVGYRYIDLGSTGSGGDLIAHEVNLAVRWDFGLSSSGNVMRRVEEEETSDRQIAVLPFAGRQPVAENGKEHVPDAFMPAELCERAKTRQIGCNVVRP